MSARRPQIHGRSIVLEGEKLHVRGVTYGTFRSAEGYSLPPPDRVRADFEAMAAAGTNALRTYEPPPLWLLEMAAEHGLKVMVGLAWEQHIAFLDEPGRAKAIVAKVVEQVRACEAHPAILAYALGNEIPAPIVRWHGKGAVEGFLERLYWEAKAVDPEGLFTYVNYPSTEYLELPFLDLTAFNVFLEDERTFESYLARLQNLCGDRPLLIAEVGIDSARNGEELQARTLEWQIRHAFGTGAAGVFVFSWTDEWHRGGHEVSDWDFGLVDRQRQPKQALAAVRDAYGAIPFSPKDRWPRVSVVVCTHNGERTLGQCLERAGELAYPDFELIVVDDGSSDGSADIALARGATLVQTEHGGLSFARNAGVARATGEIVAFLDDDAYPDSDWLRYVAASLRPNAHAGTGGPNIPPDDDGWIAECVAAAPGGPIHVLISDREAEHVPGCNMAFRKSALEEIGGFDERFRVAGDDVDICWRLQESGRSLGFSAGAVVMHRRRDTVWRYLKQQYGYGKAEALLERKWPSRYNRAGSSHWSGKIYDSLAPVSGQRRGLIRYGTWGSGLFQSIYEPAPSALSSFLAAPELFLLIALLGVLSVLAPLWSPLMFALPLFGVAFATTAGHAFEAGCRAHRSVPGRSWQETVMRRLITAALFFGQPIARLAGRLRNGLTPWRRRLRPRATWPRPRTVEVWAEEWRSPQVWLQELQDALAVRGGFVRSGGPFDRWDLDLRVGLLGGVRIRTAVEEHGSGRQLLRARIIPHASPVGAVVALVLGALAVGALVGGQHAIGVTAALTTVVLLILAAEGTATAMKLALDELERLKIQRTDEERGAELNGDDPLAGARGATSGSPWPLRAPPGESARAVVRQATALTKTEERRR
jgi:glycosyltransferase involved in cell wall biosynthesis